MSRARRPRKGDHVLVGYPKNGIGFRCEHCGTGQDMASPCDLKVWCAASKAFFEVHKNCPPPKEKP